ncbi:class I SAM-dependent methyltransferase [Candidatus Woesearchaeota archaeon]|nr:class I SAM-dependent methyltransferase [Candidatus Woesearchaeota archaeon]
MLIKDLAIGCYVAFFRKILGIRLTMPMMKQREIRIIRELIIRRNPKKVLEWGSGISTIYYPKLLKQGEWHAIEHDKGWCKLLSKRLGPKAKVHHAAYNKSYKSDGTYEDFKEYVDLPQTIAKEFDLILVDGRARVACLKKAKSLLAKDGVIILHDANRDEYRINLGLPNETFLDQSGTHGGIMVYANNLDKILNISRHKKDWARYRTYGKIPIIGRFLLLAS